jgi:hypothetical protein
MTIVSDLNDGVKFSEIIRIDEGKVRQHVEEVVRSSVEETHFNRGKVYIRHVMTHEEYDKGTWKGDC